MLLNMFVEITQSLIKYDLYLVSKLFVYQSMLLNNVVYRILYLLGISIDPEGKYEALNKYGNDLTELASRGKLDPVIGRDDEIRRCIQILSRRTKNNPVIIGEPGVGKTAIAEG